MNTSTSPELIIAEDRCGQRLDNFLFTAFKHIPKTRVYRAIRSGEVRVNKKRAKPLQKLQKDDVVRIPPPFQEGKDNPRAISKPQLESLEKNIIYEDEALMVFNKPASLAVHGGSGLQSGLIERLRQARPGHGYFELAHRIDRLTSGCLLVAKKRSVLRELHQSFACGQVRKTYLAVVQGQWPKSLSKIEAPLASHEVRSGERIATVNAQEGKLATTLYRVLAQNQQRTLIQVRPKTGRMHQIRAHCLHAGFPLVNDPKYNSHAVGGRMGLHAHTLQFRLPSSGQSYAFDVPADAKFHALMGSDDE